MKQIYNPLKCKKQALLHTQREKSELFRKKNLNKTIDLETKHANKTIQHGINSGNEEELESINVTRTCYSEENKLETTLSAYDNKGNKILKVLLKRKKL